MAEHDRGYEPTQNEPPNMKLPKGASPTVQERILAEAELKEGVIYRLTRVATGYAVQKIEGQKTMSNVKPSFARALHVFIDAVVDAEAERRD